MDTHKTLDIYLSNAKIPIKITKTKNKRKQPRTVLKEVDPTGFGLIYCRSRNPED